MRILRTLAASLLAIVAPLSAQCTLTVDGDGSAGSTMTFNLAGGGANMPAILFVGWSDATRTLNIGPLGSLTILKMPAIPVRLGRTDGNGDASRAVTVAPIPCVTLYGLAVTAGLDFSSFPPSISSCSTDVVEFTVGC